MMANTITIYILLLTTLIHSDWEIKLAQHEYQIQNAHRELKLNYRLFAHETAYTHIMASLSIGSQYFESFYYQFQIRIKQISKLTGIMCKLKGR